MSEQECFLSVNKHLFFASGAKQPCSVPLCGTPLKASERKQNSAWRSRAPHVYIQIWDKYSSPSSPAPSWTSLLVKLFPVSSEELQTGTVSLSWQLLPPRFPLQDPLERAVEVEVSISDGLVAQGESGWPCNLHGEALAKEYGPCVYIVCCCILWASASLYGRTVLL